MKFALIGHPVSHSLSPVIHQAAYRELGLQHEYGLIDAASEADVATVVASLRSGELSGINVTIPWKRVAYAAAERRSELCERLQVANVLCHVDGRIVVHNTDALALEVEFARLVQTPRALVIGSGGAAPAVVAACRAAGIAEVFVTARRFDPAQAVSAWPGASELTRLGAEDMRRAGYGRVLQLSSVGAFQPSPMYAVYSAAKSYVLSFSYALNDELRGTGVSVTTVCPGVTETEFHDVAGHRKTALLERVSMTAPRVASIALGAMWRRKPMAIPGLLNRINSFIVELLPRRLSTAVAGALMRP